jgi:hypothetical protein
MVSGIFHGGVHAARKRIEALENGNKLSREWDYYVEGASCCTCFWKMLGDEVLKGKVRGDTPTASVHYVEIVGKREDIEADGCIRRFTRQKTSPLTHVAWMLEDLDTPDERGNDCIIKMCYKTENGTRVRKQALERAFPEDALIEHRTTTTGLVLTVLEDRTASKEGNWDKIDGSWI